MKKLIKPLIFVFIFLICIIVINFSRNYMIFQKILSRNNEIFNSSNYHIKCETNWQDKTLNDIYYKDEICLINTYVNDVQTEVHWKNYLTNENYSYAVNIEPKIQFEFNQELLDSLKYKEKSVFQNKNILKECLCFNIIEVTEEYYIIKNDNYNETSYYNKIDGTLIKTEYKYEDDASWNLTRNYVFELNTVTDKNIERPEV